MWGLQTNYDHVCSTVLADLENSLGFSSHLKNTEEGNPLGGSADTKRLEKLDSRILLIHFLAAILGHGLELWRNEVDVSGWMGKSGLLEKLHEYFHGCFQLVMGVPPNGWCLYGNIYLHMDDLGGTPILGNL